MPRMTIRERRQQLALQSATCAKWGAEILSDNPSATKQQVLDGIQQRARAAGFSWLSLLPIVLELLAKWFGK